MALINRFIQGGGGIGRGVPEFTYTGQSETIVDDGVGWRIKFKTSGTFTLIKPAQLEIDAFLVGGGGSGGYDTWGGSGGGGGQVLTKKLLY